MPHTLTRHPNYTVQVDGHLEVEVVERERQHILETVRRRARVPGFRPGKAPLAVVKSRFADEIRSELEEHLGSVLWQEVLDAEDTLMPLTRPEVQEAAVTGDGRFVLSARMEVRPVFELPELEEGGLPEHSLEVLDSEIDGELEKLQRQHASWEPADDAVAEDGMLVEADLHGEIDGGEEPYDEDNARFVLGAEGVPSEINEALQGATAGASRVATKRFPDDDPETKRAGKQVRYTINVKALKRRVQPPVEELVDIVGMESLDELRQRIRDGLTQRKRSERRNAWRRHLLDRLQEGLDSNDLPSSLVQAAVEEDLHRMAYTMAMQGMSPDSEQVNWQELAARMEPAARRRVLDSLVLEQLADAWDVEVPEHDVDALIAAEASQHGVPSAEHKANLAREGRLDQLRHAARTAATIDELIRRAGGEVDA